MNSASVRAYGSVNILHTEIQSILLEHPYKERGTNAPFMSAPLISADFSLAKQSQASQPACSGACLAMDVIDVIYIIQGYIITNWWMLLSFKYKHPKTVLAKSLSLSQSHQFNTDSGMLILR